MPTSDYTPSDAAKAYASRPQMSGDCGDSIRRAFDAGCAHALATVTPRTISFTCGKHSLPSRYPQPVRLTADKAAGLRPGSWVRGESNDGSAVVGVIRNREVAVSFGGMIRWFDPFEFDVLYIIAEATDPEDPRVEVLAEALHDRGGCNDEWPKCSPSTLGHYRDAARSLLPVLDAARADA